MSRRLTLPFSFALLALGFWWSVHFQEVAAGVAFFLFGMLTLERGFRAFTGGLLEQMLARTTGTIPRSLTFGIVATTIMQSSSLVSVITISFLSAGLLDLAAGVGIIYGANLGTTTGAWLIAGFGLKVKLSAYAMPLLVFGVVLLYQKGRILRGCGSVLVGIALLFVGIDHLKEGFESLRAGIDLSRYAIPGFLGVVVYTFVGAAATVVIQSSHATLVLIITALGAGQVSYENALALAIGANIGTTITAILGALGANVEGRRLAGAHLVFNVVTAVLAVALLPQLATLVTGISRAVGIPAGELTLELAVFHTLFNTLGIVVMLPALRPLVAWLERVFPAPLVARGTPRHLNESVLELGDTTLEAVRLECVHLYDNVVTLLVQGLGLPEKWIQDPEADLDAPLPLTRPLSKEDYATAYQHSVKALYAEILAFVARAPAEELTSSQVQELQALRDACRGLVEAVKDVKHLRKNLLRVLTGPAGTLRDEYADLRRRTAQVLQHLEVIRHHNGDPAHILSLDALRLELEEQDTTVNGRLEKLIRQDRISATVATSLMNDAGYAYDVTDALVGAGEALFGSQKEALRDAGHSLFLDEDDLQEIVASEAPPRPEADGED